MLADSGGYAVGAAVNTAWGRGAAPLIVGTLTVSAGLGMRVSCCSVHNDDGGSSARKSNGSCFEICAAD